MVADIEVHNIHYTKDDPYDSPFAWGMIAEWRAPKLGLGGVVFRDGMRKSFNREKFVLEVHEVAKDYILEYTECPEKSAFAYLDPDYTGAIDTLGEVLTCTYKGIKGIRTFVGKEDYNIYFWPERLVANTNKKKAAGQAM